MTEEINKLLDRIKNYPEKLYCLNEEEKIIMLDCITNLQQENEFLKLNNPEMNIEHFRIVKENKRKIDNLRKENKELKEELEDYKSRCKKANKFIDNNSHYYLTVKHNKGFSIDLDEEVFCNTLLNILNGSDDK